MTKINALCPTCKQSKAPEDFYRDRKKVNGLSTYCKECTKERSRANWASCDKAERAQVHREWVRKNSAHMRAYKSAWQIGVPVSDVENLLSIGACSICGSTHRLRIDHDHQTGDLRGLLCDSCNKGLGFFRDDPVRLMAAAKYLKIDIFQATYEPVEP